MTYWGAPGAGGKWYKGSSADSTWNHDLLWKLRVEKEVTELHPDEQVEMIPDYATGVADRKWNVAELNMLKHAVRMHGAGNFDTILNNPKYEALRTHSETALREKWRYLERNRLKGVAATKAEFRKVNYHGKKLRQSPLSKHGRNAMRSSMSSPSLMRGQPQTNTLGGSGVLGAEDLPGLGALSLLKRTLDKEKMVKERLKVGLHQAQKLRNATVKDLHKERSARIQAERALRKYQRVLNTLMKSGGDVLGTMNMPSARQQQYSARSNVSRVSASSSRQALKRVLSQASTGEMDPQFPLPLNLAE
jgi:hypothetical protein|eukprot:g403.t1